MTDRHTVDTINSNDLDALYERLARAEAELRRYTEADSADAAGPAPSTRRRLRTATVDTHTWDGTRDAVTVWLAGSPHHWDGPQLVIPADGHEARPRRGWTLVRWPDGIITVMSPRSERRFLEPDDDPDDGDTALAAALRRSETTVRDLTDTLNRVRSIPSIPPQVDPGSVQGRFYTNGWQDALDRIRTELVDVPDSETTPDRLAQSGVHTPGCDCGHNGMGISWHSDDCGWRRSQLDGSGPEEQQ